MLAPCGGTPLQELDLCWPLMAQHSRSCCRSGRPQELAGRGLHHSSMESWPLLALAQCMLQVRAEGSLPRGNCVEMSLESAWHRLRQHHHRIRSGHHHHAHWPGMSVCPWCPCTTAAERANHSNQRRCSEPPEKSPWTDKSQVARSCKIYLHRGAVKQCWAYRVLA